MCDEMKCELLGQIPLDPNLLLCTEGGTWFYKENNESPTSIALKEIVEKIIERCNSLKAKDEDIEMNE